MVIADFNGDSHQDLLYSQHPFGVTYFGDGIGNFTVGGFHNLPFGGDSQSHTLSLLETSTETENRISRRTH